VICLDELGPVAAKAYPGPSWSEDAHRPHFRPDYARHGYRWAYGALQHRSGAALVQTAATRNTASWLDFLDRLETFVPEGDGYLIVDGLPLHWTLGTMLWNWGHPRFHFVPLPKHAAWLNLIEGFWKILRQRALAGRGCASVEAVDQALSAGVADWNRRPTPFLWGRPPRPKRALKRLYVYRI
jgi:transposase